MPSPAERIARARAVLAAAGIPEQDAALDAEVLARHALGWDRAQLLAHGREAAPPEFERRFDQLVARRLRRQPVAQIVGRREFWGLEFEVTPDVLTPRPETELLVEEAIAIARDSSCRSALDVGTGSGCIAVALSRELPDVHVTATDSSEAALTVARRNAIRHRVGEAVSFVRADLVHGLAGPFDLIVSNPPYVSEAEAASLPPEVLEFEPHAALFAGRDGLKLIERLLRDAVSRLSPGGRLIIEFGAGQEDDVRRLGEDAGWRVERIRKDLQGIPRTAAFELPLRI